MEKSDKNVSLYATAVFFIIVSCGLTFVTISTQTSNHILAKPAFICTKIEQTGKNLDEVSCIQYTHQKIHKETIALNRSVELMGYVPPQVAAASKPTSKQTKK